MIVGDEIMLMSEAMPMPSMVPAAEFMEVHGYVPIFGCFGAGAADLNLVLIPL